MPRIQPVLDLEHHITISSETRSAREWPEHMSLVMTNWTRELIG
jgi:hypothetical protein